MKLARREFLNLAASAAALSGGAGSAAAALYPDRPIRLVLPPKVMAAILRQQEQVSTLVRRKQGQRLAEQLRAEGKLRVGFTPEMRRKAAATRRAKAVQRAARKARKAQQGVGR